MAINLYPHQEQVLSMLHNGCILCGGVGSGKSRTGLAYYFTKVCNGTIDPYSPPTSFRDLYIITTAKKRDSFEWDTECRAFLLSKHQDVSVCGIKVVIDSWNNISKYVNVVGAFFLFDEQKVVGSGKWVKCFYQIAKKNQWILMTATPGDSWMDYIPVFVANGYYKNRTQFLREHAVFNQWVNYPKVDYWKGCRKLANIRDQIVVRMDYKRPTEIKREFLVPGYDRKLYSEIAKSRWNPYKDEPIQNASEFAYVLRRITNSSEDRIDMAKSYIYSNPKIIVFYNFDYELEILRKICEELEKPYSEWNGHKHMEIRKSSEWAYLVQYASGCEAWNCIETNVILFYSANHSYKQTEQACGRIDRLNTPFSELRYLHIFSESPIDQRIKECLDEKRDFNAYRDLDF